ncbi:MAG: glycosyltransferase [Cyanobacteriota bacterium]|nr:glycosyltransferase [Cyanobacteriota bacterium]
MSSPLKLVLIGSFGASGDSLYRLHQPAAALAALADVEVHEVHPGARCRDQAALAADLLLLVMGMDVELPRLVHQRHLLGRPTVLEVNDWLPGVQRCNPVGANWSDERAWRLLQALIRHCDAVQVSSPGLARRLAPLARRVRLVANHLPRVPPPRPRPAGPPRLGWGGSAGHLDDIASVAPALIVWLGRHPEARLELMADPAFGALFAAAPPGQVVCHPAGSLERYLRWLEGLHIGLAPLLPTDYNACRSDVKFLEYASRGVAPVLGRLSTYAGVRDGHTGLLFGDEAELLSHLDALVSEPARRSTLAQAAHRHVSRHRLLEHHVQGQLAFYKRLVSEAAPGPGVPLPPALERAATSSLAALRQGNGWQRIGARHWRRDLAGVAERALLAGQEAMGERRWPQALEHFRRATAADPTDPYALVRLGQALERLWRPGLARQAYERAAGLDPLCSRPRRALAALHRREAERWASAAATLNPLAPD